ncbi:MAG: DUF58 domain-containing protein, partial [Nocardioidaceae bacterium]
HRGTGAASSLEQAVTIAASVAVHLVQRDFSVRLVTAAGEDVNGMWHERELSTETAPLLESLAVLTDITHPYIDVRWLSEAGHSGLLIAVLGDVAEYDQPVLTRMRHSAAGAMAFALDVPAWARGSSAGALGTARTTAWLGAHGWRAVPVGPHDSIPGVWQELGVAGRTASSRGPASTVPGLSPEAAR